MKKLLFVYTVFISLTASAQSSWFTNNPLVVNCKQLDIEDNIIRAIEIRGNQVTKKDFSKDEEKMYVTRVSQSGRLKNWNSQQILVSVALKPSRWARVLGDSNYHVGSLEIKALSKKDRYISLYCYPEDADQ